MIERTEAEILQKCREIWRSGPWDALEIKVAIRPDLVKLTIGSMYHSPGLSFEILSALAEFFGTKAINDDEHFGKAGCETCDYGSSYGFTLSIRPEAPTPATGERTT